MTERAAPAAVPDSAVPDSTAPGPVVPDSSVPAMVPDSALPVVTEPHPAMIEGRVDALTGGRVFGWVRDRNHPDSRITVELSRGGRVIASTVADLARSDLAANGVGDGHHAFEVDLEGAPGGPGAGAAEGWGEGDAALVATAISPLTGARLILEAPSRDRALRDQLARLAATVEGVGVAQRQIANATHGLLRDIRDGQAAAQRRPAPESTALTAIEEAVAELATTQQTLQKQMTGNEVFLLRFDTVLRELDERLSATERIGVPDRPLRRGVATLALVVGMGLAALAAAQVW